MEHYEESFWGYSKPLVSLISFWYILFSYLGNTKEQQKKPLHRNVNLAEVGIPLWGHALVWYRLNATPPSDEIWASEGPKSLLHGAGIAQIHHYCILLLPLCF